MVGEEFCCCRNLWSSLEESVMYLPRFKSFGFYAKADDYNETKELTIQFITHCPFCGAKLPCLVGKYLDVLEEELGDLFLENGYSDEAVKLYPNEFQTDEWWKKRGL